MDKSDSGDGVSQSGDSGGADDDADPEVTAIAQKLDDTGNTLGAIQALEQLIITRTGAIPIIRPSAEAEATPAPAASAAPEAPEAPAGRVVGEAGVSTRADSEGREIEWSLPAAPQFDDEPSFSPWVDPEAIAAAQDDAPVPSYSDVTTQVFAVFSADRDEPRSDPEPDPSPVPLAVPTASLDVTPPPQLDDLDDDDVIDDVIDDAERASPAPTPAPATGRAAGAPDVPRPADAPQPVPARRRRFWLFGRR